MIVSMRLVRSAFLITMFVGLVGCSTRGRSIQGISNFDTVTEGVLYRGGQPSREGIKSLKKQGVRTIVNLRADTLPWEKEEVEKAGMNYVFIPTLAEKTDPASIERFLRAMETEEKPVFVHCRFGRDRTGLNVAMYRIIDQGWARDEAIRELHEHGYQWAWFPGIENYLTTFDARGYGAPKSETGAASAVGVE
jgi:uncharacterized protein (TIGR01244 family)